MKRYYRLTGPAFRMVEGPFKGRGYRKGVAYSEDQIPPEMLTRFTIDGPVNDAITHYGQDVDPPRTWTGFPDDVPDDNEEE